MIKPRAEVTFSGKEEIGITLWIEPEPQVRQTTNSARWKPGPIKYNGWKHRVREAVKAELRKQGVGKDGGTLLEGPIQLTALFYVSSSRRYKVCDLGNYIKALEDMINGCSDDASPYEHGTIGRGVWTDDRLVFRYGEGTGKYWEPDPEKARIELTIERIPVEWPKK